MLRSEAAVGGAIRLSTVTGCFGEVWTGYPRVKTIDESQRVVLLGVVESTPLL